TVGFLARLGGHVRRLKPDVVHTTSLKADLLGTVVCLLAGRPLVWYVHDRIAADYLPRPLVGLVRAAAHVPRAVIANSVATARTLPRRSTVAFPGFAADQVAATRSVVPSGGPVVGIIGRISPTKG